MGEEAAKCEAQAADTATELKNHCEAGLAEAIPALETAEKALQNLDKSATSITEMKALKSPPFAVKMTMAGI